MKTFTSLLFLFLISLTVHSQQISSNVFSTAGENVELSCCKISYTIGEISTKTVSSSGYYLTEGFQQGEIVKVTSDTVDVRIYPNPVTNNKLYVFLPTHYKNYSFVVKIYSMNGQILTYRNYKNTEINILDSFDFIFYPRALYFVSVESINGQYKRTFKIEKN